MRRRYFYARVTRASACKDGPVEIIAGVEVKQGELAREVYRETREILDQFRDVELRSFDDQLLANVTEQRIKHRWPDGRSYFLEVGRGPMDEYVQVYQE